MYRDESETLLEADRSDNFAAAFVRNLRCSTVKGTDCSETPLQTSAAQSGVDWLP